MADYRIGVIADVHGNIWALEAVLKDIEKRKLEAVVNLGDCAYGPLRPRETMELLISLNIPTVRGNQDRILVKAPSTVPSTLRYTIDSLDSEHLQWISKLPVTTVFNEKFFLCHGTPHSDEVYLSEGMSTRGAFLNSLELVEKELHGISYPVVLCGHSHTPRITYLPDNRLILNPGSVGLQAYSDDLACRHKMETGSPHARYAILTDSGSCWTVEQIALTYDWERAAKAASRNGRNDWANAILTGRAS